MKKQSFSTRSGEVRRRLNLVIKARSQYARYLREVAVGERPADADRRDCLKKRCDLTLAAWRRSREAWKNEEWIQMSLSSSGPPA